MADTNHDESSSVPLPKYLKQEDLKQEEVSPECKEIISSLPREDGWSISSLYQYQGFWRIPLALQGLLGFQKHFEARDSDILLVTTLKSGTTWLKALLFATLNRHTYHPNAPNHPLLTNSPHLLLPPMEAQYIGEVVPFQLDSMPSPRLLFTHTSYSSLPESVKRSLCKIVFLCRNPKDNFVSLWHFTNKLRSQSWAKLSLEEAFDRFCRGVSPYGPFWEHVLGYWLESLERPEKVMVLKYEDVKEQPVAILKTLARFIGCSFSSEEEANGVIDDVLKLCSFESLSNLKANQKGELPGISIETNAFFRRGEVGDWLNYLTPQMAEKIDFITQQKLSPHGLTL